MTHPLVESARKYMGVPWRHRGRTPAGLDCAGLPLLAYSDIGVSLPDMRAYGREPYNDGLTAAVSNALGEPVSNGILEGDVCIFRFEVNPHHIGIITVLPYGGLGLLHAFGEVGRVTEHRLDGKWFERITSVHRREI